MRLLERRVGRLEQRRDEQQNDRIRIVVTGVGEVNMESSYCIRVNGPGSAWRWALVDGSCPPQGTEEFERLIASLQDEETYEERQAEKRRAAKEASHPQ
jgi:hypothetical protein